MVTAGITNEKTGGSRLKKFRMLAWPTRKKVEKKNQPISSRKIEMTI